LPKEKIHMSDMGYSLEINKADKGYEMHMGGQRPVTGEWHLSRNVKMVREPGSQRGKVDTKALEQEHAICAKMRRW
jgi:hypothetical protein